MDWKSRRDPVRSVSKGTAEVSAGSPAAHLDLVMALLCWKIVSSVEWTHTLHSAFPASPFWFFPFFFFLNWSISFLVLQRKQLNLFFLLSTIWSENKVHIRIFILRCWHILQSFCTHFESPPHNQLESVSAFAWYNSCQEGSHFAGSLCHYWLNNLSYKNDGPGA